MPAHCSEYDAADHYRDSHKHDPRLGEKGFEPINAIEVAVLVKAISLTQGADLIEQYARTRAAEARLDQTEKTANRMLASIESPPSRPYGEWCRKPEACAGKGYCPLDPTCGD